MLNPDIINGLRNIQHPSLFAQVVKQEPEKSIPMIQAQIKDARLVVVSIIGENLVTLIEQITD